MPHLFTLTVTRGQDVVTARQRAAEVAAHLGLDTSPQGTSVRLQKFLLARSDFVTADRARAIVEAIAARQPRDLVEEVQQQNQQLLRALDDLQRKQDELSRLNRELEDTNRGVLAPYADLASRAGGFWPGNDFNATETAHERSASRQWRMTRRCRR